MNVSQKLALLAVAGVCGTLSRYWLSGVVQRLAGPGFPWGTWSVNIFGCFLFGLVWVLSEERLYLSSQARVIILVGFMGAFTTFSSYMFETTELLRGGEWIKVAGNFFGQNVVGLLAMMTGMFVGRVL
ncbi:fluoride efflux transporter CrcB [Fundidesulfovibrio butyratiphilus]